MITPNLWLVFIHTLLTCTLKLRWHRHLSLLSDEASNFLISLLYPCRLQLDTFCLHRSHFNSECRSFDISPGYPERGSNHTTWSHGWHSPEVSQVQCTWVFDYKLYQKVLVTHKKVLNIVFRQLLSSSPTYLLRDSSNRKGMFSDRLLVQKRQLQDLAGRKLDNNWVRPLQSIFQKSILLASCRLQLEWCQPS